MNNEKDAMRRKWNGASFRASYVLILLRVYTEDWEWKGKGKQARLEISCCNQLNLKIKRAQKLARESGDPFPHPKSKVESKNYNITISGLRAVNQKVHWCRDFFLLRPSTQPPHHTDTQSRYRAFKPRTSLWWLLRTQFSDSLTPRTRAIRQHGSVGLISEATQRSFRANNQSWF